MALNIWWRGVLCGSAIASLGCGSQPCLIRHGWTRFLESSFIRNFQFDYMRWRAVFGSFGL